MNNYIKKLEAYPDLEVAIIRETKINKVLKALVKLNSIPRDEEFQFRKRSVDLLGKWNTILGAEPADAGDQEEKGPSTNGVHEDKKKDDVEEPKDKVASPAEAAEKISAEVPASADAKASVIGTLEKDAQAEKSKEDVTAPESTSEPQTSKENEAKDLAAATELKKDDAPSTEQVPVVEKAPESAAGAAEAQQVVQSTE